MRLGAAETGCSNGFPGPGAKRMKFTAVYQKQDDGYAAFVEELPGANSQGKTLEEARRNLAEAVNLVPAANRQLAEEGLVGQKVIREPFVVPAS